jgi:hypothetical protein
MAEGQADIWIFDFFDVNIPILKKQFRVGASALRPAWNRGEAVIEVLPVPTRTMAMIHRGSTTLAIVPRPGDMISVWIDRQAEDTPWILNDTEVFLTVEQVVLSSFAPEAIEVWVRYDTYDIIVLRRIFNAIDRKEQP